MHSVHGYYNGSAYVALEPVEVKPNQKVIITILDEDKPQREKITLEKLRSFVGSEGQSCPKGMDVQEYISMLREDRVLPGGC